MEGDKSAYKLDYNSTFGQSQQDKHTDMYELVINVKIINSILYLTTQLIEYSISRICLNLRFIKYEVNLLHFL